jgi:hypothetical protein
MACAQATARQHSTPGTQSPGIERTKADVRAEVEREQDFSDGFREDVTFHEVDQSRFEQVAGTATDAAYEVHEMAQMGAKRIGSLAIGIGVVGIVLNQMSNMDMVANSTGVVDVSNIFSTAGSGLELLVLGVIIAAAAVLLSLWSGF